MFAGLHPTNDPRNSLPGSAPRPHGQPSTSLCSRLEGSSQALTLLPAQVTPLQAKVLQTWQLLQEETQNPFSLSRILMSMLQILLTCQVFLQRCL